LTRELDITIDGNKAIDNYGLSSNQPILFALCSSPELGRKQITPFFSCRDYINDVIHNYYNNKKYIYEPLSGRELLDIDRLRLLVTCNFNNYDNAKLDMWQKNLYVGKRIINLYEELAGFKKKTVIAKVKHSQVCVKHCWQLVGPKEWMRYSHLVSMVTLILRCVIRSPTMLSTPHSINDAEDMLRNIAKTYLGTYGNHSCSDYFSYMPTCLPIFSKLMRNFEKVFNLSPEEVHMITSESNESWHTRGGIFSLCSCDTKVRKIDEVIRNLKRAVE